MTFPEMGILIKSNNFYKRGNVKFVIKNPLEEKFREAC
jgi:hypothetical protein